MRRTVFTLTSLLSIALAVAGCKEGTTEPAGQQPAAVAQPVAEQAAPAPAAPTVIEVPEFKISTAPADVAKGQEIFAAKGCPACHKIGAGKLVGPDLKGITKRRDETWIKKMILHPEVMIKEDEAAKKLFVEHLVPMPNQNVDPKTELPLIMSYLKSVE